MAKKMLIDAGHSEEIRLAILDGQRVENFESETARSTRNNIYLAKITRVEPSLQAAFVEYGENRQGFLPFTEIHPDYFQIPVADREALLQRESEAGAEENRESPPESAQGGTENKEAGEKAEGASAEGSSAEGSSAEGSSFESFDRFADYDLPNSEHPNAPRAPAPEAEEERKPDDSRSRSRALRHAYKIQEVIKPRQILLVQIAKTQRGSKGAALTTYISLAGRYCVLMPNTVAAGGVSRKISSNDREQLRYLSSQMEVPEGMSLILRTAGAKRSPDEIRHDFDYLLRLWENIRSLTLSSTAPAKIYEEGNLIHRSLRDLYDSHIDEVWIEGKEGYEEACALMKILMPSDVGSIKFHEDSQPLFDQYGVEEQVAETLSPRVALKSGGYLVINQTEALVAIDVNSGRFTSERDLEDTALKTNLEACAEIARQTTMRDLAGLIIIDFIDMEKIRHIRDVERRLVDLMRRDRARVHVGRISGFGLLEMSRQRLRAGMTEAHTEPCPHCEGSGRVLSPVQAGLSAMRAIEAKAANTAKGRKLIAYLDEKSALYIMNHKAHRLAQAEDRYDIFIEIAMRAASSDNEEGAKGIRFRIEEVAEDGSPTRRDASARRREILPEPHFKESSRSWGGRGSSDDSKPRGGGRKKFGNRGPRGGRRHSHKKRERGENNAPEKARGRSDAKPEGKKDSSWWRGFLSKN